MKYYDDGQMKKIRQKLEKEILTWKGATARKMLGSLTFFYKKSFFAFLVTKGIVITKLPEGEREELSKSGRGRPFEMTGAKVPKSWIMMSLEKPEDTRNVIPFVQKSYEALVKTK
ncbi:MAG: hypothetical protein FJ358_00830 [Thaumarchaeota archaeon]|nr:hypothetical protein [Nitrososphaerota archaeon]